MCSVIIMSFRKVHGYVLDYSRDKTNWGLNLWSFQGYWRNSKWIFLGLIKSNFGFPGVIKKNNVEYPEVVVLGLKIYVGRNTHNFVEFLGVKHHFVWDFQGWSKKSKNSSVFSKKYVSMSSTPPPLLTSFLFDFFLA